MIRALFKENVVEALIGLIVVLVAAGFVAFAYDRTQAGARADGYLLKARFPNVAGVSAGTDVRISGIKVGRVVKESLDPASFEAVLEISVDKALQLPVDSSAAITTEGVLGGTYVALTPGGDSAKIAPGGEITETSGAADLMGLIGSFVNRSGSSSAPAAGATPAAGGMPATTPAAR